MRANFSLPIDDPCCETLILIHTFNTNALTQIPLLSFECVATSSMGYCCLHQIVYMKVILSKFLSPASEGTSNGWGGSKQF